MKNTNTTIGRRKFMDTTLKAGAVRAVPSIIPSRVFGANDRINAAVLGLNGRGKSHIKSQMSLKDVNVTTLCDPDMNILRERQNAF